MAAVSRWLLILTQLPGTATQNIVATQPAEHYSGAEYCWSDAARGQRIIVRRETIIIAQWSLNPGISMAVGV